jgi:hypothetical protein
MRNTLNPFFPTALRAGCKFLSTPLIFQNLHSS